GDVAKYLPSPTKLVSSSGPLVPYKRNSPLPMPGYIPPTSPDLDNAHSELQAGSNGHVISNGTSEVTKGKDGTTVVIYAPVSKTLDHAGPPFTLMEFTLQNTYRLVLQ
ncbi:hypothetical protein Bpfe_006848, partial [Biomphalaria pfeifferi]